MHKFSTDHRTQAEKIPTLLSIGIIFNVFYQLFRADTQFWKNCEHSTLEIQGKS